LIILCTHNNGGVGKTTLAVHVTGVLISKFPWARTLLLDCDDQHQAWEFFAPSKPKKELEVFLEGNLSLIYNPKRENLLNIVDPTQYDYIVIDAKGAREDTVKVIVNDNPDKILIPINASQKSKALGNLDRILYMISKLEANTGLPDKVQVTIVPLGVSKDIINNKLATISIVPHQCEISQEIRYLQDEMQEALYEDKRYIWTYENCDDLYGNFCSMINL
jgi:chromosome partitioning protein